MRKVNITKKQLKLLEDVMDSQKSVVSFTGNNAAEMGANAQEKYDDAKRAGLKNGAITMLGRSTRNDASDNNETKIQFDTNTTSVRDAVTKSINNYVSNGGDINKVSVEGNPEDITNGIEECVFTKGQIKQARLDEMKRTGTVMTKGDMLREASKRTFKS